MSLPMCLSIFGAGHLTEAILEGLARVSKAPVRVYNRTRERIERLRQLYDPIIPVGNPEGLAEEKAFILLIIPAQPVLHLPSSLIAEADKTGCVFVSCAAGLPLDQLEKRYPGARFMKAIPNINCRVLRGVTLLQKGSHVSPGELALLSECLEPITLVHEVESEGEFDRLAALTSCAPGLVAEIMEQFCGSFGVQSKTEQELFVHSVLGTAAYIIESKKQPEAVVKEVANPGGLTQVGVDALKEVLPQALTVVRDRMERKIRDRRILL